MPRQGLGLSFSRLRGGISRRIFDDFYLFTEVSGELTPTDLFGNPSSGQGFTLVNTTEITPTTVAITDDDHWELNGDSDLTPTT